VAEAARLVVLGRVLGAHGVRGWLKIQSFTEPPEGILQYRHWQLHEAGKVPQRVDVAAAEFDGRWLRVRFAGVADRDAAELLRGAEIEIERAELPPPGEREHYRDDLLGFAVRNLEGVAMGSVSHFVDAPAGAVMVVKGEREHWVLATPTHLKKVRMPEREIEVDWPADL
jgi:16S rRNA processing protein RimM